MQKQWIITEAEYYKIKKAIDNIQTVRLFFMVKEGEKQVIGDKERKLINEHLWNVMEMLKTVVGD